MKNRVLYIKQCRICSVCGAVKQKERNSMTVGHKFRSNLIACDKKQSLFFQNISANSLKSQFAATPAARPPMVWLAIAFPVRSGRLRDCIIEA